MYQNMQLSSQSLASGLDGPRKSGIPPAKKSFAILTKSKSTVEDVVAIRPSRGFFMQAPGIELLLTFDSRSSALRFELGFTLNMFLVAAGIVQAFSFSSFAILLN